MSMLNHGYALPPEIVAESPYAVKVDEGLPRGTYFATGDAAYTASTFEGIAGKWLLLAGAATAAYGHFKKKTKWRNYGLVAAGIGLAAKLVK